MKELFIRAHEQLIEEYLEQFPGATEMDAYNATADAAYARMTDMWADRIDAARAQAKDCKQ